MPQKNENNLNKNSSPEEPTKEEQTKEEPTSYFALKKKLLFRKKEKAKKEAKKAAQRVVFRYIFNILLGIFSSLGCTLGFFILPIIIPFFDVVVIIFYILGMRMRLWQWLILAFLNFIAIFLGIIYFLIIYCIIHPVNCGWEVAKNSPSALWELIKMKLGF